MMSVNEHLEAAAPSFLLLNKKGASTEITGKMSSKGLERDKRGQRRFSGQAKGGSTLRSSQPPFQADR